MEHAVLEQVAEAAERDQVDRVAVSMCWESSEYADAGVRLLDRPRRAGALVGEGRRHPDVDHHEVGAVRGDGPADRRRRPAGRRPRGRRPRTAGRALPATAPGPPRSRPARQRRGQGRCRAARLSMRSVPPCAATRSATDQPEPGAGRAPRRRRRRRDTTSLPSRARAEHDLRRPGVLDRIGQAFAGDEVRRGLHAAVEALLDRVDSTGTGARRASSRSAGARPASSWAGGSPWASSRSSSMATAISPPPRRASRRRAGAAQLMLGVAQRQSDRDEALLGAVVQVALDPPPLLVRRRDDPGPGGLDLGELPAQLHPQPHDLDRQPAGGHHLAHSATGRRRPGRGGRAQWAARALDGVAHARVGRRRQPARVDVDPALGHPEAEREPGSPHTSRRTPRPPRARPGRRAGPPGSRPSAAARRSGRGGSAGRARPGPGAQRPERHRDQQRGHRGRPGRAAAERGAEQQGRAGVRRGQDDGHARVDDRAVDDTSTS